MIRVQLQQLGMLPQDYARDLIEKEGGLENCVKPFSPKDDVKGPYIGTGNDNEWGQKLAYTLTRIMNADFAAIPGEYDRAANLEYPGGISTLSHDGADQFWMGLRASFPDAQFKIHHQIGREDPFMPPRAALRWSLHGKHAGWGSFGAPTGADVFVFGATHVEFGAVSGETQKSAENGRCLMKLQFGNKSL